MVQLHELTFTCSMADTLHQVFRLTLVKMEENDSKPLWDPSLDLLMWPPDSCKAFGVMSLQRLIIQCSLHGLDHCVEIHLTFLSSVRGEAVCLYHVWHEVYPTLPTGETQSHSHRYVALFLKLSSCFPWLPSCCMRCILLVTWLLQAQVWVAFCRYDDTC